MNTIASIRYDSLASAKAAAARSDLFNVRYERRGSKWHIVQCALEAGGADIANKATGPTTPVVEPKPAPTPPVRKEKAGSVVNIIREFTRAHPELSKAEVVDYMVKNYGINKGTAGIQWTKVKKGEV